MAKKIKKFKRLNNKFDKGTWNEETNMRQSKTFKVGDVLEAESLDGYGDPKDWMEMDAEAIAAEEAEEVPTDTDEEPAGDNVDGEDEGADEDSDEDADADADSDADADDVPDYEAQHKGGGRWIIINNITGEQVNEGTLSKEEALAQVDELNGE